MNHNLSFSFSPRRRRAFLGLLLLPIVGGCGSSQNSTGGDAKTGSASNGESQQLTVISAHGLEIQNEFARVFKAQNPGVTVKWVDKGASSDMLRFLSAEFKRKNQTGVGIDCVFGGGDETHIELEREGMLVPLGESFGVPEKLNGVPLVGKNNSWVAANLSGFGVLYNKAVLERDKLPMPKVWGDMGAPQLRNRIALADPRHSGSAHAAYEIILQTNGWDKGWNILTNLAANARGFSRSSSDLPQDVARGEAVMAPAIDFYARAAIDRAGDDKLGYVIPQGQSVVTGDPISVLKGAPNEALAKKWVAFVLSPAGQKLWMLPKGAKDGPTSNSLFRQPSLPKMYQPIPADSLVKADPYASKNARAYDSARASLRRKALDDLIGAALIDNQKTLAQIPAGDARLNWTPLSESELDAAAKKWSDATFRAQTTAAWGEKARAHFGG